MGVRLTCYVPDIHTAAAMLEGLTLACQAQLRQARTAGAPLPKLYESGVRYKREPMGQEVWQLVKETLRKKSGDCEDLAAFRAAELREGGERGARAVMVEVAPGMIHCVVRRANGKIEDPSAKLGMRGPA